ncbi:MAG: signal peptidase I [Actinomycetota bacterium]
MIATRHVANGFRWPLMIGSWIAWGFVIGMVVAVTVPAAFGLRPMTVLTGSMRPTIQPGDMVVDERIPPSQIRVGDIVTFQEPHGTRTITHRVRDISISEGQAHVTTRGDANDTVEKWQVPVTGNVGRVAYTVPKIGYPVTWSHTRNGRLALVSIPALILAFWAMLRIWRSTEDEEPEEGELVHG